MHHLAQLIGFFGVFAFLFAYLFLTFDLMNSNGLAYLGLNLFGSVCIIVSLLDQWNFPAFIIELLWAAISLIGIYRNLRQKAKAERDLALSVRPPAHEDL
jgi:hypothetical protein